MLPTSVITLAIVIVAVLPGSMYTWAFERQVSAFGVTLADRVLRFIAISLLFHLVLGWAEYGLFRLAFSGSEFNAGQFASAWFAVLLGVAIPAVLGTVTGGLYATRNTREGWAWLRRHVAQENEHAFLRLVLGRTPAPRAWDNMFSDRPTVYLRIQTTDGAAVAGLFADDSYAGGFPNEPDLYLEQAWEMADDGSLTQPLGYPVYIPAGQIARMEIVPQMDEE